MMYTLREKTLLNAVVANTTGTEINVSLYGALTFQVIATGGTVGGVVTVECSLNGTNWVTYKTWTLASAGTEIYGMDGQPMKYVRASVSSFTNGAFSVLMLARE